MVELSERVSSVVGKMFRESDRQSVGELLERECANNLPFMRDIHDPARFDRARMAVLKLANGDLEQLNKAIELGKRDWRDLFMAAGFGQPEAHLDWYTALLTAPNNV